MSDVQVMNYGAALKAELRRQGRTQRWLAQELGVTTPAVSHWVQGVAKVPQARRNQIEALLDWQPFGQVDLEDLEGRWERLRTPLAFLLSLEVPEALVPTSTPMPGAVHSHEYRRRALDLWARWLQIDVAQVVRVAEGTAFLREWQVRRIYEAGVLLTYLGEHLGVPLTEIQAVERWQEATAGTFHSFEEAQESLRIAAAAPQLLEAEGAEEGRLRAADLLDGRQAAADTIYEYWLEVT